MQYTPRPSTRAAFVRRFTVAIHEKVIAHAVTAVRLNIQGLDYKYIIRVTLESNWKVFMYFVPNPPADNYLTFDTPTRTAKAFMFESQYAPIYHILQSESTVFCTAIDLFGVISVNITTEPSLLNGLFATVNPDSAQTFEDLARILATHKSDQKVSPGG